MSTYPSIDILTFSLSIDVVTIMNRIQERHKTSKTSQLCDSLKSTKDHLERFGTVLEVALKNVLGGEVLWANINIFFVVASNSAETFPKLLEVLVTIREEKPELTILADAFEESALIIDPIEALYVVVIRFWVGGAKLCREKDL